MEMKNDDEDMIPKTTGGNIKYLLIYIVLVCLFDATGLSATALGALLKFIFYLGILVSIFGICRVLYYKIKK